jgi:hypothetical protein
MIPESVRISTSATTTTKTTSQNTQIAADAAQKGLSRTLANQGANAQALVVKSNNSTEISLTNIWGKVKAHVSNKLNLTSASVEIKKAIESDAQTITELRKSIATNKKIINSSSNPNNLSKSLQRQNEADQATIKALENKIKVIERNKSEVLKLLRSGGNTTAFKSGSKLVVVTKDEQGKLSISKTNKAVDLLGAGGFGVVYRSQNISLNESSGVIKVAKDNRAARADVQNEHTLLRELHKDGPVKGLQAAPHAVFKYTSNKLLGLMKTARTGYVGVKYDGDGFDLFFKTAPSNTAKADMIGQIVEGRNALKKAGIYHGDIKPENMLFRQVGDKVELVIADFGGARKFSDLFEAGPPFIGAHTPAYLHEGLANEVDRFGEKLKQNKALAAKSQPPDTKLEDSIKKLEVGIQKLMEKIDDFALGLSLLELWAGQQLQQPNRQQAERLLANASAEVKNQILQLLF